MISMSNLLISASGFAVFRLGNIAWHSASSNLRREREREQGDFIVHDGLLREINRPFYYFRTSVSFKH